LKVTEVIRAWGKILRGDKPSLSIEITRECPLRCPGCYAYEDAHLGNGVNLRQLSDFKGEELVRRVLEIVDAVKQLHLSIVGGDPLVRYREMDQLLPQLIDRGIHVQVVTSAFRPINPEWAGYPKLNLVVSIDGLPEDHDVRRAPATYERILKNIAGQQITVHCTLTSQQMRRPGYLEEFCAFWDARPEVKRIWFSMFTPQRGESPEEVLSDAQRRQAVEELGVLDKKYAKVHMPAEMLREFLTPPQSPAECIFAQTTATVSADLVTPITPCQFGGDPDCAQCGCAASMGLAAIGNFKIAGFVPVGALFGASLAVGRMVSRNNAPALAAPVFPIIR
jgi:sulfatase maturation enzyme AslB (radical SAM superfamily)